MISYDTILTVVHPHHVCTRAPAERDTVGTIRRSYEESVGRWPACRLEQQQRVWSNDSGIKKFHVVLGTMRGIRPAIPVNRESANR